MSVQALKSALQATEVTSGVVADVQGSVVLVATTQGTKRMASTVGVSAGDEVTISKGVIVGVLKKRASLRIFEV